MKRIFTLLAIATIALTGCQDLTPAPEVPSGKLDPNAKVYISPAAGVKATRSDAEHLTAREIIEQADEMVMSAGRMGIGDWNRDTINNRIIGSSTWVIAQAGDLETVLIASRDIILRTQDEKLRPVDTIAYIKNSVMIEAESKIRAAFQTGDYTTCYQLFEEAFVFNPITGAEWLELKAQGQN